MAYQNFHPDKNFNFQLNRALFEGREDEIAQVAPKIRTFEDWKREMLELARKAESENRTRNAFAYYRAAEFFMLSSDPDRFKAYEKFMKFFYEMHPEAVVRAIPYENSSMHAIELRAENARGDLVIHAGFDAYIEEFYEVADEFRKQGYNVFMFDGPGQGTTLVRNGMTMTPEWQKPTRAVLDYFKLEDVTLIGISLGGCLAPRAAVHDTRIKRVVCFDVLTDFLDVLAQKSPAPGILKVLVKVRARKLVNAVAKLQAKRDMLSAWGLQQGMHIMGVGTPFDFFEEAAKYETRTISSQITQDVLVLAGAEDHFIPGHQFEQQMRWLTSARSKTGLMFTRETGAQNHCQFGNIELAIAKILGWIAQVSTT